MNSIIETLRPRQWTKNLIIFTPILFSEKQLFVKPTAWLFSISGFLIFCFLSGSVYLLNDMVDSENDKLHPEKKKRPIPSGRLSMGQAKFLLIALLSCSMFASFILPRPFFFSAILYFILNAAYSFFLKNVVILDILSIALGFVIRAEAGVGSLQTVDPRIHISHWLILCTFMLALFLGMAKRRGEIKLLKGTASSHRKILDEYSIHFIDDMTSISGATTVLSYALYTVSSDTIAKFGTDSLIYTIPFVIYGIFRYLYIIHIKGEGDNPSEILLSDKPLQINLLFWIAASLILIHLPN
ncbi:MAG: decaprenyl-phosphate phosphoribosyltransferase [Candidatus Riflebacteria bacterium]|nr:decaprenyl-phosphate phosphoribosyltransferase [Candidatus Riflebacteria bacterium]